MNWKTAGAYLVVVAIGATLIFGISASRAASRNVSWDVVNTYTDNTPIEAGNTVTYSVWMQDSVTGTIVQLANRISPTSVTFSDSLLTKGRAYNFWAASHLATGLSSDNSAPVYAWLFPAGKAKFPAGLLVQ